MRILINAVLVAFVLWSRGGTCFASETNIEDILSQMAAQGNSYNAAPLLKEGERGLSRLLDRLFPATAKRGYSPLSEDAAVRLVRQLGAKNFNDREKATLQLANEGEAYRELVMTASGATDPEVSDRANLILRQWDIKSRALEQPDISQYTDGFSVYLAHITNTVELSELAQRTRRILESEASPKGSRLLLAHSLRVIARSGRDELVDHLIPVLKHKDTDMAVWVTGIIGPASGNAFFPNYMVEALKSDKEQIVDKALDWTPNCADRKKAGDVRRLVAAIFDGDNERLKFQACFPLMHSYGDARAISYLLSQVENGESSRSLRAIGWIGDACNSGRTPSEEIMKTLVPLIKSDKQQTRHAAANALATYQGKEVILALEPILKETNENFMRNLIFMLSFQRDKKTAIEAVNEILRNTQDDAVRINAKALLLEINKRYKPISTTN